MWFISIEEICIQLSLRQLYSIRFNINLDLGASSFLPWFIMLCLVSFYGLEVDRTAACNGEGEEEGHLGIRFFPIFLEGSGVLSLLKLNILH